MNIDSRLGVFRLIDTSDPVINAKTFAGAAFDGSTNDTTAVQAAATAAAGKTLFFPAGTTRVAKINIPANTHVTGVGSTSILKPITFSDGRDDPVFSVDNNVTIAMLKFDGNNVANTPSAWSDAYNNYTPVGTEDYKTTPLGSGHGRGFRCGIRGEEITGLTVLNCEFTNMAGAGVATNMSSNVTVANCYHHDTWFELAYIYGSTVPDVAISGYNIAIINNRLVNVTSPAAASAQGVNPDGCVISRAIGVSFLYNTVDNVDRCFVKSESCQNEEIAYNTGINATQLFPCFQVCPDRAGGIVHGEHPVNGVHLHHNSMTGPGWESAVQLNSSDTTTGACQNVEVDHNVITGGGTIKYGVLMDGTVGLSNINVHDNSFVNTVNAAIYVNGGGTTYALTGNTHNGSAMTNHSVSGSFSESTWYN